MKRPVLRTQNGIDTLSAYLEETRAYMNKLEADNDALVEALRLCLDTLDLYGSKLGIDTKNDLSNGRKKIEELLGQAKGDV